jgi:hypothetical protein
MVASLINGLNHIKTKHEEESCCKDLVKRSVRLSTLSEVTDLEETEKQTKTSERKENKNKSIASFG